MRKIVAAIRFVKLVLVCFAVAPIPAQAVCLSIIGCKPKTLEECRQNAADMPTETGVRIALSICYSRFNPSKEYPALSSELEDCRMNVAAKVRTELGVRLAVGNCNIKYPIRPKPTPEMTYSQPYEPAQPSQAGRQEAIREQEAAQQKAQAAEKKREEDAYRAEIALREQLRAERVAKQAKAERERKAHPVCVIKQAMTNAEIEICKNER